MNCPKCGNELKPNMKFCAKCGTAVQQPDATQTPAPNQEFAQPMPDAPQNPISDAQAKPSKQMKTKKTSGKKNIAVKVIAIILVIAVLATGGLFITDGILYKNEIKNNDNYITDFPVLKQETEFLVYDAEKFPYEEYNIKVDRFKTGKVFKSSKISGFENVVNERSNSAVFDINFEEDGKYQITLTGIVSERTQATSVTQAETTTTTAKTEEPKVIVIIVIVDNESEDAVDKVTVDSKEGDEPIAEFSTDSQGRIEPITQAKSEDESTTSTTSAPSSESSTQPSGEAQTQAPTQSPTQAPTQPSTPGTSFSNARVGEYIKFGKYEQDNNTSNGKEDIEWLVLDVQGDKALIISRYALDNTPYNEEKVDVTWETCTMRSWLNNEFYNTAFSSSEKNSIRTTNVVNNDNSYYGTEGGNNTQDKVFLLSIDEANKYFSSDEARKCVPTDYAVSKGTYQSGSYTVGAEGTCLWSLRTPGYHSGSACYVYSSGSVSSDGYNDNHDDIGVRPALWVNL